MKKIWIVLKSEFIRRVRSKWFIIGTLIAPIFMVGLVVLPAVIGLAASDENQRHIVVLDDTGVLLPILKQYVDGGIVFTATGAPPDVLRADVRNGKFNGFLHLPLPLVTGKGEATYYSVEGSGLTGGLRLERSLNRALEAHRLREKQVPADVLEILDTEVEIRSVKLTEEGEETDSAAANSVVGYIMGFIMYIAMFVFGAYVIQGVLEEKANRVIEVMVSSIRPFQMLMGKVLGIGLVGVVQMAVWSLMMLGVIVFAGSLAAMFMNPADLNLPTDASTEAMLEASNFAMPNLSPVVFVWFVLFFFAGYLLYASLFAAVSSVVEQQQDAQGLLSPIYMLIIIPIMFIVFVVDNPNSTLSVILSMVPFFSPILMIVRVAVTYVSLWEVGLSFAILLGSFFGAMWVSSRIYRVGILMYGKKPKLKDLARWISYQ